MAVHIVTKAKEDMAGTLVKSYSGPIDYKPELPSMSVVKQLSDMRSEIERALTHLSVVTKNSVEAIVQNRLTKWTNRLKSHIVKAVHSILEDALQVRYFNLNIGLRTPMFTIIEKALSKVVQSGRAPKSIGDQEAPHSSLKSCSRHHRQVSNVQDGTHRPEHLDRWKHDGQSRKEIPPKEN